MEESFLSHLTLSVVDMFIYKGISGQCEVSCHLKVIQPFSLLCCALVLALIVFISSSGTNLKYILYLGRIYYDSVEPDISCYEIIIVELIG